MNKTQLVDSIARKTSFTKTDIETILNAAFDKIRGAVGEGEDVTLVGFGTFTRTQRKARAGRNPQTGKEMEIPAMVMPRFRPGKEFRDSLN